MDYDVGTHVKETVAQLFFIVPDGGQAYSDDEVNLIRRASSGHSWTVSRSYTNDRARKTLAFKIFFKYKVATDMGETFPGLEEFASTLKSFLEMFEVSSGENSGGENTRNSSQENLNQINEEKYTCQFMKSPPRHSRVTEVSFYNVTAIQEQIMNQFLVYLQRISEQEH